MTELMYGNIFQANVQMLVIRFKVFIFDRSYSPVSHSESFIIKISIVLVHILTSRIFDVTNSFQNKNVPIHKIVYVSPPPYYLELFEISYPNVTLNRDDGPFFIQCMDEIRGTKLAGQKLNQLLDIVVTILKYKKITIYHAIYIKVFSNLTVSFLTFIQMVFSTLLIMRQNLLN